ncbi:MAG: hypothetical protein WD607_01030 [Candidatus Paceibacterota bacterium]
MKSLKSLFALIAIVTLSFGCASVTDASLNESLNDQTDVKTTTVDDGVFNSGGAGMEPVIKVPD